MLSTFRVKAAMLAAGAGVLAALTVAPTPALAYSSECKIGWTSTSCRTGNVLANAWNHFLDYSVCGLLGGVEYRVRDVHTNVVVKHDNASGGCESGRINGLYGTYRLELNGFPNSVGKIDNEW